MKAVFSSFLFKKKNVGLSGSGKFRMNHICWVIPLGLIRKIVLLCQLSKNFLLWIPYK